MVKLGLDQISCSLPPPPILQLMFSITRGISKSSALWVSAVSVVKSNILVFYEVVDANLAVYMYPVKAWGAGGGGNTIKMCHDKGVLRMCKRGHSNMHRHINLPEGYRTQLVM